MGVYFLYTVGFFSGNGFKVKLKPLSVPTEYLPEKSVQADKPLPRKPPVSINNNNNNNFICRTMYCLSYDVTSLVTRRRPG